MRDINQNLQARHLFSLVTHLKGVQRFSRISVTQPENVLEHTGMVAIFAYVLTHRLNALAKNHDDYVSLTTVLARAVVHDWDEVVTGDITRPTKYFSPELRAQLALLERIGITKIEEMLDVPCAADHAEAKDKTREGFVLSLCDIMASVHAVWQEVLVRHNHHAIAPAKGIQQALRSVLSKYDEALLNDEQRALLESLIGELHAILGQITVIVSPLQEIISDAH